MSASKKLFRIQHRASIEYFLSFIFLLQSVPLLKEKTTSKKYDKKTLSYELSPTAKGIIIWIYLMHIRMSINSLTHKPLDYKNNGSYWAVIKLLSLLITGIVALITQLSVSPHSVQT